MARRRAPGRNPAPVRRASRPTTSDAPAGGPAVESAGTAAPVARRAAREAQVGFILGVLAMFVLPLAYQWTFRPASNPLGSTGAVVIVEVLGIAAAAAALLLGRRARAARDRSSGAIWAPRLGAAAMVGYVMTLVLMASRGA